MNATDWLWALAITLLIAFGCAMTQLAEGLESTPPAW